MLAHRSLRRLSRARSSTTTTIIQHQQRSISLLHKQTTQPPQLQQDLDHAIYTVKNYDPAGYLPGRLLPTTQLQMAYFAVRSFWIETGLRFGSTARVGINATPCEHLQWWQESVDTLWDEKEDTSDINQHPTLRLLKHTLPQQPSAATKSHLNDVLQGRRNDLDLKQYPTLQHLEHHAALSCGSLSQLVLETGNLTTETNPIAHQAARLVGMGHGLTNALRTSIPVISTTGKLIVPQDLCELYGVSSPRYLLSALGQGDVAAKKALNQAVRDIALRAQQHFESARDLRDGVLAEDQGDLAVSVLLPGLASETFLQRLADSDYDLTDRNLRNVGTLEHWQCAIRMTLAYYQKKY